MRGNSCRPAAEATERLNLETCLACSFHCEQLDLFLTRATRQTVNKGHSTGSTLTKGGWTTEARKEGLQNQEANSRRQTWPRPSAFQRDTIIPSSTLCSYNDFTFSGKHPDRPLRFGKNFFSIAYQSQSSRSSSSGGRREQLSTCDCCRGETSSSKAEKWLDL